MIGTGVAAVIEIEGLHKRYGDRPVLCGVDLAVARGEVFGLLGPNGAGKTTTIEILEGFRQPDLGTVRVLGFDPATHARELRARTGVVLQECGFPLHLRVGELIDAWRSFYPAPRPARELLAIVELTAERDAVVRQLSGGQRRRLDFALALAGAPELIFLDEPTTGFDPEARRRCWDVIESLRALGTTIVLTTNYLDEAEHLADRVAILQDGRIRASGTISDLARQAGAEPRMELVQPSLEEVYLDLVGTADGMG
ncbi:MAG: ABC transporter ATP-binding protein [Acidimicrobiales bacterium]